jgi:mannosyltransferase OCH1-like enzyme
MDYVVYSENVPQSDFTIIPLTPNSFFYAIYSHSDTSSNNITIIQKQKYSISKLGSSGIIKNTNTYDITFPYYINKFTSNDPKINMVLFQTFWTRDLPPGLQFASYTLNMFYPLFNKILYTDKECIELLNNNFDENVLIAFNRLRPGAYKADLFRYCALYVHGGIYADIKLVQKYSILNLITSSTDLILTEDRIPLDIYNGFIGSAKGHPFMKYVIDKCIDNISNNYYGETDLAITGPKMLGEAWREWSKENNATVLWFKMEEDGMHLTNNGRTYIFKNVSNYGENVYNYRTHYSTMWATKNVYNDISGIDIDDIDNSIDVAPVCDYAVIREIHLPDVDLIIPTNDFFSEDHIFKLYNFNNKFTEIAETIDINTHLFFVGSYIGVTPYFFNRNIMFPCKFHLFEPQKVLLDISIENLKEYSYRCTFTNKCVNSHNNYSMFPIPNYLIEWQFMNLGTVGYDYLLMPGKTASKIESTTLDTYYRALNTTQKVSFICFDNNNTNIYEMLFGSAQIITRFKPVLWIRTRENISEITFVNFMKEAFVYSYTGMVMEWLEFKYTKP